MSASESNGTMVNLTIDGLPVAVPAGTLLVEAAKRVRTDVPVYCYHPKLGPAGLCRICLVDVEKTPKLQIACNTAVAEGMVVHTYGPKVEEGRRAVLEFLLLNHPLDCPICDKGGECDLQDFSMAYGQGASRLADPKELKPKAIDLGPTIVLDDERCIVCQRCTRFDEIITQERSLVVKDRGQRDVIATASGAPYRSNYSGNVTELCPVGALTSKTYRFKSRPWDLQRTLTTCAQCSVGCAINVDVRHGQILRTMSVPADDAVSEGWLCDRGRYNVGFYDDPRRLTLPMLRSGEEWSQIAWDDAIGLWAEKLKAAGGGAIAALGGGRLLNEEAYLLQHVMRALGSEHLDWRTGRQRQASAGPYAGSYEDLERAQAIVLAGIPPAQSGPVLSLRIRKAVARHGARLIVVGDYALPSLAIRFERVAHVADLFGDVLAAHERIALVWDGMGRRRGFDLDKLAQTLVAAGKTVHGYITGESPNARGAEAMGMLPGPGGLATEGIFEAARTGKLHALALFGVNPMLHYPGDALDVERALQATPFVVASELFMTETAQRAHLVLPARAHFEKRGHTYDLTGSVRVAAPARPGPQGTLSDGEMLVALADALGVEIPAPDELQRIATQSPPRAVTAGFADAALFEGRSTVSGARESEPAALHVAVAVSPFAGGGTMRFDPTLDELRTRPALILNARTAAIAGVAGGDLADLAAPGTTVRDLAVRIDEGCVDGVVTVYDGLPEAPAAALRNGEAVSVTNVRGARETAGVA